MKRTLLLYFILAIFSFGDAIKSDTELSLTIKGVPQVDAQDFNGPYSVYSSGTINLPMLGSIKAEGKTPATLAREIESRYKLAEIYTNPTVNVGYKVDDQIDQQTFTFRSQAGSKVIPYQRDMTLQEAIASGGGAGTFDSKKFAILERSQKEYKYDMRDIQHRNVRIYPKDVIKLPHINSDTKWLRWLGSE